MIDSLLNFAPASVTNLNEQQKRTSVGNSATSTSSVSSNSPLSSQVRKGRGHHPKVPSSSSVHSVSAQKISLETIVECLNKINEQNKALLNIVEVLSNKVENNVSAENAAIS